MDLAVLDPDQQPAPGPCVIEQPEFFSLPDQAVNLTPADADLRPEPFSFITPPSLSASLSGIPTPPGVAGHQKQEGRQANAVVGIRHKEPRPAAIQQPGSKQRPVRLGDVLLFGLLAEPPHLFKRPGGELLGDLWGGVWHLFQQVLQHVELFVELPVDHKCKRAGEWKPGATAT